MTTFSGFANIVIDNGFSCAARMLNAVYGRFVTDPLGTIVMAGSLILGVPVATVLWMCGFSWSHVLLCTPPFSILLAVVLLVIYANSCGRK